MSDLIDVKIFLASLIRPIIKEEFECFRKELDNNSATAPQKRPLRYKDAAELLGISEQTLMSKKARGEVPFVEIGNRTYFFEEDLIDWLRSQRTPTIAEQAQQYNQSRSSRGQRRGKGQVA